MRTYNELVLAALEANGGELRVSFQEEFEIFCRAPEGNVRYLERKFVGATLVPVPEELLIPTIECTCRSLVERDDGTPVVVDATNCPAHCHPTPKKPH